MADTARTLAALQTLLADNSSNLITAQNVRDFLVSAYQPQGVCNFRLGLEDGVAVSTTDQTAKSVIYLNPVDDKGNRLGLTDGTSWTMRTLPKCAVGGLTGLTSGKNYDVFAAYSTPTHSSTNTGTDVVTWSANPGWTTGTHVTVYSTGGGLTAGTDYWYNRASSTTGSFHTTLANAIAGTSKVDLTANITQTLVGVFIDLGPTWDTGSGSDTARGTGAGSTALTKLNGINVNSVSVTGSIGAGTIAASAGLLLGTVRTTGTTTVELSFGGTTTNVGGKIFVANVFNPVWLPVAVIDTTTNWTYTSATIRQVRATSGNKVEVVAPLTGIVITLIVHTLRSTSGTGNGASGVGVDVTNAFSAGCYGGYDHNLSPNLVISAKTGFRNFVPLGYHAYNWLEQTDANPTHTWYGNSGQIKTGLEGQVLG